MSPYRQYREPQPPTYHFTMGDLLIVVVLGLPLLGAIYDSIFN